MKVCCEVWRNVIISMSQLCCVAVRRSLPCMPRMTGKSRERHEGLC